MKKFRPKINSSWLGTVNDGKKLELSADIDGKCWDLITIVADDKDESLWAEVVVEDKIVQIPIEHISKALEVAPGEVHSESWYKKNVYKDEDA